MAQRSKPGIDYFPFETDTVSHKKIKLIVSEFSAKAWGVIVPLWCKIYKLNGYWIDWEDQDLRLLFAQDECKLDLSFVNEVVSGLLRRGLFDNTVFEQFGVLTSDRIQENYLEAKRRQKEVEIIEEFYLLNDSVTKRFDNVNIIGLNVNILTKKVNAKTQIRIEKNRKESEKNEKVSAEAQTYTPEQLELFKNFQNWIDQNAPSVGKMKEPFKIHEFLKLKSEIKSDVIMELLLAMHNKPSLTKDYKSANLTLRGWYRMRKNNSAENEPGKENETNRKLRAAVDAVRKGAATG